MTVRQWMDENLPRLHGDKRLYGIYRRVMSNWQFSKTHGYSDDAVMRADIEPFLDDENYPNGTIIYEEVNQP